MLDIFHVSSLITDGCRVENYYKQYKKMKLKRVFVFHCSIQDIGSQLVSEHGKLHTSIMYFLEDLSPSALPCLVCNVL